MSQFLKVLKLLYRFLSGIGLVILDLCKELGKLGETKMKLIKYIIIGTFIANTTSAASLEQLDSAFRTQNIQCQPMKLHSLDILERQKLIQRRQLQIKNASEIEQMYLDLAQDARKTSRVSKAIGFLGVTPLLMAGATVTIGASGMAAHSALTGAKSVTVVALSEQTIPFITIGAIAGANGFILYKDYQFITEAARKDGVNVDGIITAYETLLKDITAKSCDLSKIHEEIKERREQLTARFGGAKYRFKNLFGGEAEKLTAALYTLSVIDRMVYEMELYQLENSGKRVAGSTNSERRSSNGSR